MNQPEPAYSGHEPYMFVSYSHRDKAAVYAEIFSLQEMGFNVWYDEGIDAGDEWTDTLANAIVGCVKCIYFVTPDSVRSEHCRREINFTQYHEIPVTAVHLVTTELPHGVQLALGNRQAILKYNLSPARYRDMLDSILRAPAEETMAAAPRLPDIAVPKDDRHAILVLPFVNRSKDEEADFFCEGIADEIIAALSTVGALRVIAGSAARQIDPRQANLQDIYELLGVTYVLEGSVQSAGNRLRVSVRLPQTKSGEVLWADRWDGANDEIFDIQDSISLGVLDALKIELGETQSGQVVARPIPDVNAYEYFLRARQSVYQWTPSALNQALDYLQSGEDIIGENEYIIAARGYIHWQFHNLGLDPDPSHLDAAQACIDRLFEMDTESAAGHRLQGLVKIMSHDEIESAVSHLEKALAQNPNDIDTLFWLSQVLGLVGRVPSGMALAERLLKLDPITSLHRGLPAVLAMMDGDVNKATELFGDCHDKEPDNPVFALLLGQALAMSGQGDRAIAVFDAMSHQCPDTFFAQVASFFARCIEGRAEQAAVIADEEFLASARYDPQTSWTVAQCYALLGERDEAIQWVANAIKLGFWNYPLLAKRDALLAHIRDHERFQSLMVDLRDKWISFGA